MVALEKQPLSKDTWLVNLKRNMSVSCWIVNVLALINGYSVICSYLVYISMLMLSWIHQCSYRWWGTWNFPPLSGSFPPQALLTSVIYCVLLSHPKSIMSPYLAISNTITYQWFKHFSYSAYSHTGCWGSSTNVLHKQRAYSFQCLGHGRSGEVWWIKRRLLHSRTVCHHHVRCDSTSDLQKCPKLASWSGTCLRKHPHCVVWEQGGH